MMRPAGMPPEFFVSQGRKDKEMEQALMSSGSEAGGMAELGYKTATLANFLRGGPWDAQRIGGSYHPDFVDYSTVAIGLYAAANGISRTNVLTMQDMVARSSQYPRATEMDSVYTHLPTRNVFNTDLGYSLYDTGQIHEAAP